MECSMLGVPVPHQLLEPAQIHVHWVGYAIHHLNFCYPFSSCLHSCPASRSFLMSWLFMLNDQNFRASALASVVPMNIQGWFPLGLTHLISFQSKGLSRVFSSSTVQKHQFFSPQTSWWLNSYIRIWLLEKPELYQPLSPKWCLCFLTCCLVLS